MLDPEPCVCQRHFSSKKYTETLELFLSEKPICISALGVEVCLKDCVNGVKLK